MAVLAQLSIAAVTLLIGLLLFRDPFWGMYEIFQAAISLLLIVILFERFLPFVFFSRTKGEWLSRWVFFLRRLIYVAMPVTIALGFLQSVATLTGENTKEEPETSAEAVDALIEAGQEEGIIQEGDRDLIQSVVEFRGKTVREPMKPRPAMLVVPTNMTVEQLIEILRVKHYARVPVYEGGMHNIKGIVYHRTYCRCRTAKRECVRWMHHAAGCVLCAGKQIGKRSATGNAEGEHPYGNCSGRIRRRCRLVTIEDLVEEIVGEMRRTG